MSNTIEFAKQEIQRAFSGTSYPGDYNLVDGGDLNDPERFETKRVFTGKPWETLGLEELYRRHYYLSFLSAVAYRYYLPAFLLVVLNHYEEDQAAEVCSATLTTLLPSMRKHNFGIRERWLKENVDGFTELQKQAIKLFLETLVEIYDDERAIDALKYFWHNPVR